MTKKSVTASKTTKIKRSMEVLSISKTLLLQEVAVTFAVEVVALKEEVEEVAAEAAEAALEVETEVANPPTAVTSLM